MIDLQIAKQNSKQDIILHLYMCYNQNTARSPPGPFCA